MSWRGSRVSVVFPTYNERDSIRAAIVDFAATGVVDEIVVMMAPGYLDEVIVFLGASYFRAVGRDQVFGLSARALAIDTAAPWGEEFPFFREFWIERPAPDARAVTVYALLDSPGITGAYGFGITVNVAP